MNPLVKKEIRLLLPAWIVAMLLALPPICTRSDDGIPVILLFVGMTLMALSPIGRETTLNTFSQLLAQPAERTRIWRVKLSVLSVAFLMVFAIWRLAFMFSFKDYGGHPAEVESTHAVLFASWMTLITTFTGALWTTILLRQVAGALWITLLAPACLAGITAVLLDGYDSSEIMIGGLSVVLGIYSVGGFLFARWLFFRAQDSGWTGGVITLPDWKFRSETAGKIRRRRPISALVKKEFQLQQISLLGAAGLLVLHLGIIALRKFHHFPRNSTGEVLTSIFWMLWLVLPVIVGCMAVAEERRQGVMEGQLCLPASRRVQFAIKALFTLLLGVFLGGVMPMILETAAANQGFSQLGEIEIQLAVIGLSAWLVLVSFFASSLVKNFLSASGLAIVTFLACMIVIPVFAGNWLFPFDTFPRNSILPLIIAVPTIIVTLLWLAYLNFKDFRDGWPLWRRNLLGFIGALVFISASSAAIYHRAWEFFEPVEPHHGPARLSAAQPPKILCSFYSLLTLLPDGRLWTEQFQYSSTGAILPRLDTQRYLGGSNWVAAAADGFRLAGIQSDGSLWSAQEFAYSFNRIGSDTDWSQVAGGDGFLLLKKNGTLWFWGANDNEWLPPKRLKKFLAIPPRRIGEGTNWTEVFFGRWARRSDGSFWIVSYEPLKTNGAPQLLQTTDNGGWLRFASKTFFGSGGVGVKTNGELWLISEQENQMSKEFQLGKIEKWKAVAFSADGSMITLRSDGTLWRWPSLETLSRHPDTTKPSQLGSYSGWIALFPAGDWDNKSGALAADGSLWIWNHRSEHYWLAPSRKPLYLGNVFGKSD